MTDILFKTDDVVFSYRVAGICIKNGCILLQKPINDTAYAVPGGHVSLGETNEVTLKREFYEEVGAEISVGALRWVGELFFPWGERRCHQICLYYEVDIPDNNTPTSGSFWSRESMVHDIEFHWIPLAKLDQIEVYPPQISELMGSTDLVHFVYSE